MEIEQFKIITEFQELGLGFNQFISYICYSKSAILEFKEINLNNP